MNDLPAQSVNQRVILALRVTDDNVVLRDKESVCDLPLGREGFAGAGCAEDQTVRVFQLFPIHHNHVVGKSVQPVVERFALHEQLLRRERHKDRRGGRGQRPLDRDQIQTKRQAAHQALLLHIVQTPERTVVFLRDARRLKDYVIQFLLFSY